MRLILILAVSLASLSAWAAPKDRVYLECQEALSAAHYLIQHRSVKELGEARKRDQFFTINPEKFAAVLSEISLKNHQVVEFGVGTGIITKLTLAQDPLSITGYELDEEAMAWEDPKLQLKFMDFKKENFEYLQIGKYAVIANPPYSEIPFIKHEIIDRYAIEDVLMVIPSRFKPLFPDFEVVTELSPEDFAPFAPLTTSNAHLLVKRGFKSP